MKRLRSVFFISILLTACARQQEETANSRITFGIAAVANPQLLEQFPCTQENGEPGVLICHIPKGNFNGLHNECVGLSAVDKHLAGHGSGIPDVLGNCQDAF